MSTKLMRHIVSGAMLSSLALGLLGAPMLASAGNTGPSVDPSNFNYQSEEQYFGANQDTGFGGVVPGQTYRDPRDLARNIINIILGFLGIIAVIIILLAGFQWMTAGGEEEKVSEARQRLIQGAIGLVLILAAWIIAYFVIDQIVKAVQ